MSRINTDNINAGLAAVQSIAAEMDVIGRLRNLPADQIELNPDNTAARRDTEESIDELAAALEMCGPIHPLAVNQIAPNRYMLISGERRYRAMTTRLHMKEIPCNVYSNLDSDMIALMTPAANIFTRSYSAVDKLALFEELYRALESLKAKGKYKGAIGKSIASMMNVSERQVSAYRKICSNTSPDERQQITNIEKAVNDIRSAEKQRRNPAAAESANHDTAAKAAAQLARALKLCDKLIRADEFSADDRDRIEQAKGVFADLLEKYTA